MVKHTQTIRKQQPTNYLSVFDHFMGLALKGLISMQSPSGDNFETESLTYPVPKIWIQVCSESKESGSEANFKNKMKNYSPKMYP